MAADRVCCPTGLTIARRMPRVIGLPLSCLLFGSCQIGLSGLL
jgi:hypothetical protein